MSLSLSSALWRATRHTQGHSRSISITDKLFKNSFPISSQCFIRPLSLTATRHRELKSKYADLKMPEESYFELVWSRAEQFKDRTAIVDGVTGRSLDYATAKAQSLAFGSELVRRGAAKDDVMAILLPNCVEYPLVFSGAAGAGVINTTLNPIYTPNEVRTKTRHVLVDFPS